MEAWLLMSIAGSLGSVANAGNRWIDQLEEIEVAGKCTREWWSCTGPGSCIGCIRRSVRWWWRAKSHRIVRKRRRPRQLQEDRTSRWSNASPGCGPSKPVSRHQGGGTGLGCDKTRFREDSNRSSFVCDQTSDFACRPKAGSRG